MIIFKKHVVFQLGAVLIQEVVSFRSGPCGGRTLLIAELVGSDYDLVASRSVLFSVSLFCT